MRSGSTNGSTPGYYPGTEPTSSEEVDEHVCGVCNEVFDGARGLASHKAQSHEDE